LSECINGVCELRHDYVQVVQRLLIVHRIAGSHLDYSIILAIILA
jgi:hypothetical protein